RKGLSVQVGGGISPADFQQSKLKFLEEARVLAKFNHPNIVEVYDAFEENNTAYMVMEFVRGKTLARLLQERGALAVDEALDYIQQVGAALQVVHQANLLHRDIKPDNIIVTDEGRAVLVDFGAARAFTKGATHRMTAMLTPGYAPLEQYGQQARFGVYTDIYALGATMYHLLTGKVPTQATDRASGVTLKPPNQYNTQIPDSVSDAVMWAMEMKATRRPQSVQEFLDALQGRSVGSVAARSGKASRTPVAQSNPYEPQMLQLVAELNKPLPPPPAPYNQQLQQVNQSIAQIDQRLTPLSQYQEPPVNLCPGCRQSLMVQVAPTQSDLRTCPLCRAAPLSLRTLNAMLCPVCRNGVLKEQSVGQSPPFCPLCRRAPLREERRGFLKIANIWWVCPSCGAEWETSSKQRAQLMRYNQDPYQVGQTYKGQTLSANDWQQIAQRSPRYLECNDCRAQLDITPDGRATLKYAPKDMYGVAQKHMNRTYTRLEWAKIAAQLQLHQGSMFCAKCNAEFDWDPKTQHATLLSCSQQSPAYGLRGRSMPLAQWALAAMSKQSGAAGWVCPKCGTEFDIEQGLSRLVRTPSASLQSHIGKVYSPRDWHRLALGLPTSQEEANLRNQRNQLAQQQSQINSAAHSAERKRREQLQIQLEGLIKRSIIEQFLPFPGGALAQPLVASEPVCWLSGGVLMRVRTSKGHSWWEEDKRGFLIVTTSRMCLASGSNNPAAPQPVAPLLWQKPVKKIRTVQLQVINNQQAVVVYLEGQQKPIAWIVPSFTVDIPVQSSTARITLGPADLAGILLAVR
ncbi:MAG: serine/threonine protein kinase, partial [Fimbriimonadales bacterium]|nr:serine/threonine protein kinase [Fimbriimonadales bacterium]